MIIGVTGTLGAGKTTVAKYLETKGFVNYSVRAFITEEVHRRQLPVDRDTLVNVGNEIRLEHGPDYILRTLIATAKERNERAIIESVRAISEATYLIAEGGILLSVDAEQKLRYERVIESSSQIVPVSFEQFVAQENRELHSSDVNKQSLQDVMLLAQFHINNSGSEALLHKEIDGIIDSLTKIS